MAELVAELGTGVTAGIIAGLVTSFIVITWQQLWINVIQPWYEERIYKDTKIEGRWEISYPHHGGREFADLKRTGHHVTGVITAIDGPDKGKAYEFDGTFKNLILTGSYSALQQRSLDRGTISVMLKNNGERFEGHSVFYADECHEMRSERCEWIRSAE